MFQDLNYVGTPKYCMSNARYPVCVYIYIYILIKTKINKKMCMGGVGDQTQPDKAK